tara:strand:- start:2826 stop:3002 length:177 start_codon:yes stop_codon:yes gene_type:complete
MNKIEYETTTDLQKEEMAQLKALNVPQKYIAQMYKITESAVSQILSRQRRNEEKAGEG